jgi:hypothetical protein
VFVELETAQSFPEVRIGRYEMGAAIRRSVYRSRLAKLGLYRNSQGIHPYRGFQA